ncbi:MAG: NUMOD3 domain-containing DNA-binding protein [Candidatus Omnitrophica bacterium]|nr:NUMOD3 domain-containing DNA-binding protein [Candidatus Omnitrophota bacterium]
MIVEKIKSGRGYIALCICDYCKKEFKRNYFEVSHYLNQLCSRECYKKWVYGENNPFYGKKHNSKTRDCISKNNSGKYEGKNNPMYGVHRYGAENPCWKGGKYKDGDGYIYIYKPEHPFATKNGYILEHRLIMEKAIGRYLTQKEVVHHKNEDTSDNYLENLLLFANNSEHIKYHNLLKLG